MELWIFHADRRGRTNQTFASFSTRYICIHRSCTYMRTYYMYMYVYIYISHMVHGALSNGCLELPRKVDWVAFQLGSPSEGEAGLARRFQTRELLRHRAKMNQSCVREREREAIRHGGLVHRGLCQDGYNWRGLERTRKKWQSLR